MAQQQITLATIQKKLAELQNDIATLIGEKINVNVSVSLTEEHITSFTQLKEEDVIRVSANGSDVKAGTYTVLIVEPEDYDGGLTVYLVGEGWVFFDDLAQAVTVTRVPK